MTAEQNYRLLQEIDANRRFLLAAYRDNPALLARAEPRIRQFVVDTAGGGKTGTLPGKAKST
jgi:hypothetical protein